MQKVAEAFNAFQEREDDGNKFNKKFDKLNQALAAWGYQAMKADGSEREIDLFTDDQYKESLGETKRNQNLCDKDGKRLKQDDYPGTILPTTECTK